MTGQHRMPVTEPLYDVGQVNTAPIRGVHNVCGWCGINLRAVPEPPKEFDGKWYHPVGCISAGRVAARGEYTETETPWPPK